MTDSYALEPVFGAFIDEQGRLLAETDPRYQYRQRGMELFDAHQALMAKDVDYRDRFHAAEARIISLIPESPSEREGKILTWNELSRDDLLAPIVATAGPRDVSITPDVLRFDEWGENGLSFILGSRISQDATTTDAGLQFHCCQGQVVVTQMGEPFARFSTAHRALYADDASYRELFDATVAPFTVKADSLPKPLNRDGVKACNQITTELRQALQAAEVLSRIERQADTSSLGVRTAHYVAKEGHQ